jgi:hypothetical protein
MNGPLNRENPSVLIPGGEVDIDMGALRGSAGNLNVESYLNVVGAARGVRRSVDADVCQRGRCVPGSNAERGGEIVGDVAGIVAAGAGDGVAKLQQTDGLLVHVRRRPGKIVQLGHLGRRERCDRGERSNGSPGQTAPIEPKDGLDDACQGFRDMHVSLVAHVDGFFRLLFSLLSALLFFLELLGRDLFRRAEWPARSLDDGFGLVTAQLHGECVVQLGCRTRREHGTLLR